MKERPILFSGPMVRAILEERKTQTRRILRHDGLLDVAVTGEHCEPGQPAWEETCDRGHWIGCNDEGTTIFADCKYGSVGDRLWVRETWTPVDHMVGSEREEPMAIGYAADRAAISHGHDNVHALDTYAWNWDALKWRPSIFMPRWASRIALEVTGVRVERLQAITESDAKAEGCERGAGTAVYPSGRAARLTSYRDGYSALWDEINRERAPWASNPWVWVVEFRRVLS